MTPSKFSAHRWHSLLIFDWINCFCHLNALPILKHLSISRTSACCSLKIQALSRRRNDTDHASRSDHRTTQSTQNFKLGSSFRFHLCFLFLLHLYFYLYFYLFLFFLSLTLSLSLCLLLLSSFSLFLSFSISFVWQSRR